MKKEVPLTNKKVFEIFIGKRVTKKELFNSKGKIQVYSANVFKPFGYLDESNIEDFSCDYLLWSIDGKFEFNVIKKGVKFATTDHCGAIKILNKNISPAYLLYQLRLQSHILGFDRTLRPSLKQMEKVTIPIPVEDDGNFDIIEQEILSKKYEKLLKIKEILKDEIEDLENINVNIDLSENSLNKIISDLFDFPETNSKITKTFCNENLGDIPVYASSKNEKSVLGYIKDKVNKVKYYRNCLSWNRNGSVGYVFFRDHKFATNEDHRAMVLKKEYIKKIDLGYIKFVLENSIKKAGFNFTNKLGVQKISVLEISFPSIEKKGFDLNKQIELRKKYESIMEVKQKLIQNLQGLSEVSIEI